jgi:hypothetical protein
VLRRAIASIHAAMASIIRFSLSETKPRGTLLPPPTLSLQAVMGPEFGQPSHQSDRGARAAHSSCVREAVRMQASK